MVESPTKRTLGFRRGKVVVVVVVVVVEVSMVVSTTVDVVVVVVPSGLVPGSAPETEVPILMAIAAHNKPAINRVADLFITLTTRTAWNFPKMTFQPELFPNVAEHYKTALIPEAQTTCCY